MKSILFLSIFAAALVNAPALAAPKPALSPELQKLDISVGRWIYHGKTLKTAFSKPGSWTWRGDCRWSANEEFLECSFNNTWSGKLVKSLVVDTYNTEDHTYWHYEVFSNEPHGERPLVTRMRVRNNTWIEYWQEEEHGKKVNERVVYRFASPSRVSVAIQRSADGVHWVTLDQGDGVKQP